MTDCLLTQGYDYREQCKGSAGARRLLIANMSEVTAITEGTIGTPATASGVITAITMNGAATFFEFIPKNGTLGYTDDTVSENGATAYNHSIMLTMHKNTAALRNQVKLLGQGVFVGIIEDQNGNYFLLGRQLGLELSTGTGGSGMALTDLNGWELTLTGQETEPAIAVDPTIIDDLLP